MKICGAAQKLRWSEREIRFENMRFRDSVSISSGCSALALRSSLGFEPVKAILRYQAVDPRLRADRLVFIFPRCNIPDGSTHRRRAEWPSRLISNPASCLHQWWRLRAEGL